MSAKNPHQKVDLYEDKRRFEQDWHDHHDTDLDRLDRTLFETLDAIHEAKIPYGLIGGVAVKNLGRPRVTNDIDVFVQPDDARKVLEVLQQKGFSTEERDPHWLFKAWREDVLVDIIFKSSGDIYFDEDIRLNVRSLMYKGKEIKTISPEDFIVIKSAVHQEHGPHHWHDALAVIANGDLNWDYLIRRARHAPRRVLSLLVYAQSADLPVPDEVIRRLYKNLYEPDFKGGSSIKLVSPSPNPPSVTASTNAGADHDIYLKGRIREALARDGRTAEQDIKIIISGRTIVARGEVFSKEQQSAIGEVVSQLAPQFILDNQVLVATLTAPAESEPVL